MKVYYMNGAGNDFMVIDARGLTLDYPALARKCCAITGADGFMATDISDKADFRLHFYNSDGTRGEMCGNGARCICRFGHDIGLAGDVMTVETDAGLVPGWRLDENLYRVKLNTPYVLDLHRKGDVAYLELGHPGVPHAVAEYKGDLWADADKLLEDITRHSLALARKVGYDNVGTWEWIVTKDGSPFLMEVNTRIQVENGVSARISKVKGQGDVDIIAEQIRIGLGEPLGYTQDDVTFDGVGIEYRLIAEDPDNRFTPWVGRIDAFGWPSHPWLKMHTHVPTDESYEIPTEFDPNLALAIIWGEGTWYAVPRRADPAG